MKLVFEGQLFTGDLIVLESTCIDVILGMDWLVKHKGMVSCNPRFIQLEHHSGTKVRIQPQSSKTATMLCNMSGEEKEETPVVCEFPDVFPKELTELPPDRDVEFVIELMPGAVRGAGRVEETTQEVARARFCSAECLTVGFTCTLRGKERWHQEDVHRLPHAQLNDDQEQIPTTKDRGLVG
jgi:hypothetical protein